MSLKGFAWAIGSAWATLVIGADLAVTLIAALVAYVAGAR